jgi:hypothetical protein
VIIVLASYCNHTIDVCPHALQVLIILPGCTSYRRMMALNWGALKTRALGIYVPSCIVRLARLFFMLEAHDPWGPMRHMAASEPTSTGR